MNPQDWLVGAGFGAIAGKVIVHRMERRQGELPASRVRHVEFVWVGVGLVVATVVRVVWSSS